MDKNIAMFDNTPAYWGAFIGGALAGAWKSIGLLTVKFYPGFVSWTAVGEVLIWGVTILAGGVIGGFATQYSKRLADKVFDKRNKSKKE